MSMMVIIAKRPFTNSSTSVLFVAAGLVGVDTVMPQSPLSAGVPVSSLCDTSQKARPVPALASAATKSRRSAG
eukprot:3712329-Prorocentrum_lima.AAC.1